MAVDRQGGGEGSGSDMKTRCQGRTFADYVRDCAQDEKVVSECNTARGTNLKAPIKELLDPQPESPAAVEVVCFIGFVHQTVWQPVLQLRRNRATRAALGKKRGRSMTAESLEQT
jgi:hypothetical protein